MLSLIIILCTIKKSTYLSNSLHISSMYNSPDFTCENIVAISVSSFTPCIVLQGVIVMSSGKFLMSRPDLPLVHGTTLLFFHFLIFYANILPHAK